MQLENQAGLPSTGRDARCVRPHQTAYSFGKRVNEGRVRTSQVECHSKKLSDSNPHLALQITDYSYFETHMLPSA